jgi:hypothetical protein
MNTERGVKPIAHNLRWHPHSAARSPRPVGKRVVDVDLPPLADQSLRRGAELVERQSPVPHGGANHCRFKHRIDRANNSCGSI